jgi:hypothetical protein
MATLAIAAAGAWVGSTALGTATILGMTGAQIGWMVGSMVGNALFAPDIEGARIEDVKVQAATYGVPVNVVYGTARVAGNIIWSTDLIEHAKDEGKGGPSYTTYSYTVSCAVAVCEGEITGIRRIWANNELIYDVSVDNTGATGFTYDIKIYTGSETQEADPRMQAEIGAADTPAHRGLAYVVFEDLALEKFGNRIPNFNFEVVSAGTPVRPDVTVESTVLGVNPLYDSDTGRVVRFNDTNDTLTFHDYWTGNTLATVQVDNINPYSWGELRHGSPGTFWLTSNLTHLIFNFSTMSLIDEVTAGGLYHAETAAWHDYDSKMIIPANNLGTSIRVFEKDEGGAWFYTSYSTVSSAYNTWGDVLSIPAFGYRAVNAGLQAGWVVLWNGDKICVLDAQFSVRLNYAVAVADRYPEYGNANLRLAYDWRRHKVYINQPSLNLLFVLDMASLVVTRYEISMGRSSIIYHYQTDYLLGHGTGTAPVFSIVDPDDLPNKVDSFALTSGDNAPNASIDGNLLEIEGLMDAVLVADASANDKLYKIPFGLRLSSETIPLSEIVEDQCIRAGLLAGDVNVTALTDEVNGYVVMRQSSARSNIEPLQISYYFDAVESDDVLKFVKRGGSSAVTIPETDIGAYEYGTEPVHLLEQTRMQETELPRTVSVNYLNIDADYQQNTQYDRRLTGDANIETTLTLPLALSDDEAAQIAAVNLYAAWSNRNRVKFKTGIEYTKYEPTDIVTVEKGNTAHTLRIVKKDEGGNGLIEWEAVSEDSAAYSQDITGAAALSMPTQTIQMPVYTRLEMLDVPLLRDVDDDPGCYYAACGLRTGWQGMVLYRSVDDGASWTEINALTGESPIGNTSNALGNYYGGHTVDELNSVTVYLANSDLTLSGTTLTNLLSGTNACLIGDEVCAFRDATLNPDGSYTISGLLRGLRGTEWAMSTHAAGDRFVLFGLTTTRRLSLDSSEIDLARDYAGVSFNTTLAQTAKQEFTNTGVGLMPYAPVHVGRGIEPDGDIVLQWVRRARTGGEWRDYVDASQPEATLEYEIDFLTDDGVTLIRTVTGITSENYTYSAANIATDFPATTDALAKIYQVSATVGRGYPAEYPLALFDSATYTRDWNDSSTADQTLYGTGSPSQSVVSGKLRLTSDASTDAKIKFDLVPSSADVDITVSIECPPFGSGAGVVFRTTYWGDANDTFAYMAGIDTGQVYWAKGGNSAVGSYTELDDYTATYTAGTTYLLRIKMTGSSFKMWVDGVLRITDTDNTYAAAGECGLRVYNDTGGADFDNLAITTY